MSMRGVIGLILLPLVVGSVGSAVLEDPPANLAPFAGRIGAVRAKKVQEGGGTAESEQAVERGLRWLALHQADVRRGPLCRSCTGERPSLVLTRFRAYNTDVATGLTLPYRETWGGGLHDVPAIQDSRSERP